MNWDVSNGLWVIEGWEGCTWCILQNRPNEGCKQSLATKDPSSWDVLRLSLMTWQPISRLTRMHPSVSEAPCISHSLSTILLECTLGFFKGIVHPKLKYCHHLLTLMLFQTCIDFFLQKKIFWRMLITKQFLAAIDFIYIYIYIYIRQAD